jgi:hypothetical protein
MPPVDLDPSDPSVVSSNKSYYRDLWLGDLNRLEDYTKDMEDKGSADIEFWRMMYMRLYRAFAPDPPMYAQPPPGMHPGMDGGMHDHQHGSDDKDVDGDLDDED